jgi:F-type H+-transporting ATPase subunit b
MIFLAEFSPIQPGFGLFFWTVLIFGLVWFTLSRVAFKPIAKALREREDSITDALKSADNARAEMAGLQSKNEDLLKKASEERALLLKEAKEAKESIIAEAKTKAKEEAQRIVVNAKAEIENQKMAAITEVKNQMGSIALGIAEKVIQRELKGNAEHEQFVNQLVKEVKLG